MNAIKLNRMQSDQQVTVPQMLPLAMAAIPVREQQRRVEVARRKSRTFSIIFKSSSICGHANRPSEIGRPRNSTSKPTISDGGGAKFVVFYWTFMIF
ncbi:hypothetical protein GWI33_010614 [Rhynchophorus ferrugineus]|uniref:Uncharacterized protein n=1 Tax=Rhynchophorus ferrugineus TaxID=354439 RepID=A0A834ISV0_RHYFE|nr:hypothetical protein GWI33_010614 [Rhynchophorus ferrugineus]